MFYFVLFYIKTYQTILFLNGSFSHVISNIINILKYAQGHL